MKRPYDSLDPLLMKTLLLESPDTIIIRDADGKKITSVIEAERLRVPPSSSMIQ